MVKSGAFAAAAGLAVWLAGTIAHAETSTLARSGEWAAFGGTTTSGRPVCGVSSTVDDRYFGLKFFSGLQTFTIQVGGKEWTTEKGVKQKVIARFDSNSPWNATATGMRFNDGDLGLEFDIARNELDKFMSEFRGGRQLLMRFPGSGMGDWLVSLIGTNSVSSEFERCVRRLRSGS